MFKQTDHPLSKEGVDQALRANRAWLKEKLMVELRREAAAKAGGTATADTARATQWVSDFMGASRIYASPLTRALQTALLVLWRHPVLKSRGLTLLSAAREIKNLVRVVWHVYGCCETVLYSRYRLHA